MKLKFKKGQKVNIKPEIKFLKSKINWQFEYPNMEGEILLRSNTVGGRKYYIQGGQCWGRWINEEFLIK